MAHNSSTSTTTTWQPTTHGGDALWSSMVLFGAALTGLIALKTTRRAHRCSLKQQQILHDVNEDKDDWRITAKRWESTVSAATHEVNQPHGVVFKAHLVVVSLLLLASQYPKYEGWVAVSEIELIFSVVRANLPAVAMLVLVFVPVSEEFVALMDRLQSSGYETTPHDLAIYHANRDQYSMHMLGGAMGFVLAPILEAVAVGIALYRFFDGSDEGSGMVQWEDHSLQCYVWLVISVLRCLTIVTWLTGTVVMQIELWHTGSWKTNPLMTSMPEQILIAQAFYTMLMISISMWFVNDRAWRSRPLYLQIGLGVVAGYNIVNTLVKVWKHLWFCLGLHYVLSDENMDEVVSTYLVIAQKERDAAAEGLVGLHTTMKPKEPAASEETSQIAAPDVGTQEQDSSNEAPLAPLTKKNSLEKAMLAVAMDTVTNKYGPDL